MIAVYARSNHPPGWGYAHVNPNENGHRAHGYSIIFVRYQGKLVLKALDSHLYTKGLPEPYGHPYEWYGGCMERIATFTGNKVDGSFGSLGDNKYVGTYDAADILGE